MELDEEAHGRKQQIEREKNCLQTFILDWLSRQTNFLFTKSPNIYMLFAGLEVSIGKNCARGLEYGPRPQAEGRTQDRGHSFSQYGPT